MSSRNAYKIYVTTFDGWKYELLRNHLDELFLGHVEETEYGFFAEDSPGVSSAFSDGDARYIRDTTLVRELREPFFEGWADDRWLDARETYDDLEDESDPQAVGSYADIVERVVHNYANDTSCVRETNELDV